MNTIFRISAKAQRTVRVGPNGSLVNNKTGEELKLAWEKGEKSEALWGPAEVE
ncbi:hypothetical protein [Brevibacillus sp. NRS-1366]|uniref:hypothetical protein n=1 Tax=Brevibacillus sp. NRS-1366 TaxID=3233899 RepID=UPI003D244516